MWGMVNRFFTLFKVSSPVALRQEITEICELTSHTLMQPSSEPNDLLASLNQLYNQASHILACYQPTLTHTESIRVFETYRHLLDRIAELENTYVTTFIQHLQKIGNMSWRRAQTFIEQCIVFNDIPMQQQHAITLYLVQLLQQSTGGELIEHIESCCLAQNTKIYMCCGDALCVRENKIANRIDLTLPPNLADEYFFTFGLHTNLISTPSFIAFGHELCHVYERLMHIQPNRNMHVPCQPTFWCYRQFGVNYNGREHRTIEGTKFSENWLRQSFGLPARGSHKAMDIPTESTAILRLNHFLSHITSRREKRCYSEDTTSLLIKQALGFRY